jgi:membrane protease YdiL (CAAX protease family)
MEFCLGVVVLGGRWRGRKRVDRKRRLALVAFPLVFLPGLLTALFHDWIIRPSIWWGFHMIYAAASLAAIGVLWLVLKSANLRFKDIGLRDFHWSHIGWAFAFFLIGVSIWGIVSALLARVDLATDWGSEIQLSRPVEVAIIFIYAVIAAPLAEELLFRGFFITSVGSFTGPWVAAVLSILMFSVYHFLGFGLVGGILMLFWAPLPTVLFLWKRSLYPGMIMHAINNLFAYVVMGLLAGYWS